MAPFRLRRHAGATPQPLRTLPPAMSPPAPDPRETGQQPGHPKQAPADETIMTLLYTDPFFLKHETGRHPETPARLRAVTAQLEKAGLVKKCAAGTCKPLTEEVVCRLHDPKVVVAVKQLAAHGGGRI